MGLTLLLAHKNCHNVNWNSKYHYLHKKDGELKEKLSEKIHELMKEAY